MVEEGKPPEEPQWSDGSEIPRIVILLFHQTGVNEDAGGFSVSTGGPWGPWGGLPSEGPALLIKHSKLCDVFFVVRE